MALVLRELRFTAREDSKDHFAQLIHFIDENIEVQSRKRLAQGHNT